MSNDSRPKSIALLVCDTPIPAVASVHGDYLAMFTTLLHSAAAALGVPTGDVVLDAYDVVNAMEYPSDAQLEGYDGVLITGSKASAYNDIEWINKLVDYVTRVAEERPRLKMVGICFGHQIVARAMGGRCVPNGGKWEVGPTPVKLTSLGKEVFGVEGESLYIEEMHQDIVPDVPPTFHLLGSTDACMNQGMARFHTATPASPVSPSDIHIFTVQGHPEFNEPIVSEIAAARAKAGIISEEDFADAQRRASWQNDGVGVIGTTILRIFGVSA